MGPRPGGGGGGGGGGGLDVDAMQPPEEHCCQIVDFKVKLVYNLYCNFFPFSICKFKYLKRMFSNCFEYKNACFEVYFWQNFKVHFGQFLDLASVSPKRLLKVY